MTLGTLTESEFINKIYQLNNTDEIISNYIEGLQNYRIAGTGIPITKNDNDPLKLKKYYDIFIKLNQKFSLNNKTVLELGSGFGGLIFLSHLHQIEAYGIEPDPNMVRVGHKILESIKTDNKYITQGFGENLPYQSNTFDYVFSFQVLEHVNDPEKVIQESIRVLKPNGILYFIMPNYNSFYEGHINKIWFPFVNKSNYGVYLKLYGIKKEKLKYVNFISPEYLKNILPNKKINLIGLGSKEFKDEYFTVKNINKVKNNTIKLILKLIFSTPLYRLFLFLIIKFQWYYPIVLYVEKISD